jgi:ABC-type glycerol-3-phosphate transport system permease component
MMGPSLHMRRQATRWAIFLLLVVVALLVNLPIILMVLNSFKANAEILSTHSFLPRAPTLINYELLSARTPFWNYFANSIIVAGLSTVASVLIAVFAGYALSRYRSPGITIFSRALLLFQMFPLILALIPLFILFRDLKLLNSYTGVVIIYTTVHLPFAVWLAKGFFDGIPRELDEAAWIDGCSPLRGFLRVILPLTRPGIVAIAIFSILFSWNEYLIASIFLRSKQFLTVPVGIQQFIQEYQTDWGSLMAAATVAMVPVLVFCLFAQQHLVHGAVAGSVKG